MKLMVFLGAGVSLASGLPTAMALTAQVFEPVPGEDDAARRTRAILSVIRDYDTADLARPGPFPGGGATGAIFRGAASTYEDLFFLCQELNAWGSGQSDHSLTTAFMERIEDLARDLLVEQMHSDRLLELARAGRTACDFIEAVVTRAVRRDYVTGLDRLVDLARSADVEELNIVTLNHDTLVEQHLTDRGIKYADGFGPMDGDVRWSDDESYDTPPRKVRIFKLHGSVDWYRFTRANQQHVAILVGDDVSMAQDASGNILAANPPRPTFLSGLNKSVSYNRGLYADIHYRFWGLPRRCDRMIICGYGWGDTAISLQLEGWLDREPGNRMILLHPHPQELIDHSWTMATSHRSWRETGRMVILPKWLSDVSLDALQAALP